MSKPSVIVIGAGIGGLVAALLLASRGCAVTVVETHLWPGGKMREVIVGGQAIDAGPTVFTMRDVFDDIFDQAGESLNKHLKLQPVSILARHAWESGIGPVQLDLFADRATSADAISHFSTVEEGRRYLAFCREAAAIHDTLVKSFMRVERPSQFALVRRAGIIPMLRTRPFSSMWNALGQHFNDPRLRQLFGRYATYCGSSPFLSPATLMLIAHVEQQGVWLIEGGMHKLAQALAELVLKKGGAIRYGVSVQRILVNGGQACGVELNDGKKINADAVIMNGDAHALATGLLGEDARIATPHTRPHQRSLSAITWNMLTETKGFPLSRHSVFFARDSKAEFSALFEKNKMPDDPTVYICAQDRNDLGNKAREGPERLLVLINAPANGDSEAYDIKEIERCQQRVLDKLERSGLKIHNSVHASIATSPKGFSGLFPATSGALYGRATHGAMASFARPGSRSKIKGLYLTGGSVHPGAGVPMVALSGQIAVNSLMADWTLQRGFRPAVIAGGMSMR